ncbi:glutamine--tRNA ligase/YqeY domain fusion protein [Balneolales bacterium ANBcel1]|nr:glutamine--tRNA ligase/YqeY domain fusion protein [Balneolales bacterium ANBcel1]
MSENTAEERVSKNFLEEIIEKDLKEGKHSTILTRFPPEPNGYLHIGHAKSISVNFGLAQKYGGETNLRFDDTNPATEEVEYVDSIKYDVQWLGYKWARELYASDYFEQLYEFAVRLIRMGLAYVDDSTSEEIAAAKGTPTRPGTDSPYRDRSPEENEDLFRRMRAGEFDEGSRTLRAKIDMASPNMLMRDPVIYRIKYAAHHRTGDKWCVYPTYDMTHGQSDAIEKITHSICTLEFMPHRELYDWFIDKLDLFPSRQYEFARLNMSYTIMSKRRLLKLVEMGVVEGWDDPRMPTISGLRRRGFTPEAIRDFCTRIGVAKRDNLIDLSLLEFCAREHLNKISLRRMVVFDPVKLVITNWQEGEFEELESENNPEDESAGFRKIPFGRELYIERDDFMEDPPKKFFRLGPGRSVRLKSAYIITCDDFVKDDEGNLTEVHCRYHPDSKSGSDTSGIKAKGTLHWVSIPHAHRIEIREYDRLFTVENPVEEAARTGGEFTDFVNPDSLNVISSAYAEPVLADDTPVWGVGNSNSADSPDTTAAESADDHINSGSGNARKDASGHGADDVHSSRDASQVGDGSVGSDPSVTVSPEMPYFQFMRKGYYYPDKNSTPEKQVFNRTATLRDTWARKSKK